MAKVINNSQNKQFSSNSSHHPSPTPAITLTSSFITRHTSRLMLMSR